MSTIPVISQPIRDLVHNVPCKDRTVHVLHVDPNELYLKLVAVHYPEVSITEEDNVLKSYRLDMPAFDQCKHENHPLAHCPEVCVNKQSSFLMTMIRNGLHLDMDEVYGNFENEQYVLKPGVDICSMLTIWPNEIWAAVFAARSGKGYDECLKFDISYFLKEGL